MTFSDLVEEVRHRPVDEMEELKHVLDHELIEVERERLYLEHLESVAEWESGKLKPTSDIDEFIRSLGWILMQIVRSSSFVRAYNRLVCGNPSLELLFQEKLAIFLKNPFDRSLKTHKLGGKLKDSLAFSLTHDLRVVFYFPQPGVAELENIGPHDKVY